MCSIRWLIVLTLFTQTSFAKTASLTCPEVLQTTTEDLVNKFAAGAALRKADGQTVHISDATWSDLDFKDLVWPWVSKNVETSFGQQHLYWLLRNPSLDAGDIRARQDAVQFFASNPKLRKSLLTWFSEVSKDERKYAGSLQRSLVEAMGASVETSPVERRVDSAITRAGGYFPTIISALFVAMVCAAPAQGVQFTTAMFMFNSLFGQLTTKSRLKQMPYRSIFQGLEKMLPSLSAAQDPEVRQIADILSGTERNQISPSLTRYAKFARGLMKDSWQARAADFSGLTPYIAVNEERLKTILPQMAIVLSALGELNVLAGLGELAAQGATMPEIHDNSSPFALQIVNGQHPFLYKSPGSIANSVDLRQGGEDQVLFLTGPNARGKSTYLKMIGSLIILAQAGAPVPAASMTLTPMQVLTNMKISDSVRDRESTFRAEVKRLSKDVKEANNYPHNLWLLDEAFVGTSPVEQTAAEQAFIEYIVSSNGFGVIASHKRSLVRLEGQIPRFRNIHASDSDEMDRRYRIEGGPSHRLNADQVMSEEGMPNSIINRMRQLTKGYLNENGGSMPQ